MMLTYKNRQIFVLLIAVPLSIYQNLVYKVLFNTKVVLLSSIISLMHYVLWSVLAVDRRSRTREQKITSGRSLFT